MVPDRRLPDGSYLSRVYRSERDRRHQTNGLTVRVIDYRLEGVVGAEPIYRLLTTILDHETAPAHELAALYHERWEIETALDELKTHLRGSRIVLRSKTPDLVRQEFYGLMMAHFAIRSLIHEAALKVDEDSDRLSFVHAVRVLSFDHCLLYGPDIPATVDFFTDVLDFSLTEKVVVPDGGPTIAAFLTCTNKAHEVAFVDHEKPGMFHHASFLLDSWHDVGYAADVIARYDISRDIGPTRHGITMGQTIYFFDPSGNRNEVFCGGHRFYPDHPIRVWTADQLGKGIFYYEKELNDRFLGVVT